MIRPLASVAFADDLSDSKGAWPAAGRLPRGRRERGRHHRRGVRRLGPKVHKRIRSGSPANEIIKAAKQFDAGLVVVAAGGRGLSDSVLVGSTAQRVQHYAPCPVLVVRPRPRKARRTLTTRLPPWRPCGWSCSFLHVLGFAALLGGLHGAGARPDKAVNAAMRDGIGTAF